MQALPQLQLRREVLDVALVARLERDDNVRVDLLRPDENFRIGLAPVELGEHLVRGISTPGAVALDLPPASQALRRSEINPHVVAVSQLGRVVAKQALDDREPMRL